MSEVNKYIKGKIYTIRCITDNSLVFVGSTNKHYLSSRFASHRISCKNGKSGSLYKHITDNDWSDWYIELHELYPCNSRDELCRREGEVIREIGTINKNVAGRTHKESDKNWRENNRDKRLESMKKWRENNPNYMKEWYARKRSLTP